MSRVASLCGRAGKRAVTAREERLAGPVGREMKPETSDAPDDARCDLEQVQTDRADRRGRESRAREDRATKICQQQQREAMQLQSEGIGAEAMAAEAIGVDIELELLDALMTPSRARSLNTDANAIQSTPWTSRRRGAASGLGSSPMSCGTS